MLILISNDDGIHAAGLAPLEAALSSLGEVWVVAPESEQSAKSHALTMHRPLRVKKHKERWFGVSGTPADSVYMALNHLLPGKPTLVVSGINRGTNLSQDILYSGTFAAAMEACLFGVPSIAVSLKVEGHHHHWETAAEVARRLAVDLLERGLPRRTLLNVNVPDVPFARLKGIAACPLGERVYEILVDERKDPRGRSYYWIGGDHERFEGSPEVDGHRLYEGFATVTPVNADMTDRRSLESVSTWKSCFTKESTE